MRERERERGTFHLACVLSAEPRDEGDDSPLFRIFCGGEKV
jgi:hypothetical protein